VANLYSTKEKIGFVSLAVLFLSALLFTLLQNPIAQDSSYHLFKDTREIVGISNFWNVTSNNVFLVVGVLGLAKVLIFENLILIKKLKLAYILLFLGASLVALGSAYYHLAPSNETLLWDRLPMTVAFMALFSIVIGEFISINVAQKLLLPLVVIGMASAIFWYVGELNGVGDLRYYVLVQFLPLLSIPVILLCFQSRYSKTSGYWWLLLAYIGAKLLELFDGVIFNFLTEISGHSLKHVAAAVGLYLLLNSLEKRQELKS